MPAAGLTVNGRIQGSVGQWPAVAATREWRRDPWARTKRGGSTEAARSGDFRPPMHGSTWVRSDSPSSCLDLVIWLVVVWFSFGFLRESELGFVGGESAAVGGVRAAAGGLVAGHRPLAGDRRPVVVVVVLGVSPGGPLAASSGRAVAESLGD
ncbi:hypothetical protein Dimus_013526, partial [Dionaea muscipula]